MDYWAETMQDDVYMIVSDDWDEAAKPRQIVNGDSKPKPDFTVGRVKYKTELIPSSLIIARYFASEQAAIEQLDAEVATIEQLIEEMAEEQGGEDGLLDAAKNDKEPSYALRRSYLQCGPIAASAMESLIFNFSSLNNGTSETVVF